MASKIHGISKFITSNSTPFPFTGATATSRAQFGQGTGAILLDNVRCSGNESRLFDCPSNSIGVHNCAHSEDAGVMCNLRK